MGKIGHHYIDFPLPTQDSDTTELLRDLIEHLLEAQNPDVAAACFYNFASDDFRMAVGGLDGIRQYLQSPQFEELVSKSRWKIIKLSQTDEQAEVILLSAQASEEAPYAFLFTFHKPHAGFYVGCWLIDSVARFRWKGERA